jgi:hypothetical protein
VRIIAELSSPSYRKGGAGSYHQGQGESKRTVDFLLKRGTAAAAAAADDAALFAVRIVLWWWWRGDVRGVMK